MLSGDVHHCYLAEVELQGVSGVESRIWQAVCSAYRKDLAKREKRVMLIFNSAAGEAIARRLARIAGVHAARAEWELVHDPTYDNQVGCLTFAPDRGRDQDRDDGRLALARPAAEHRLRARPARLAACER